MSSETPSPPGQTSCHQLPSLVLSFSVAVVVTIATAFAARNYPWNIEQYDQAKQAFASWEIANGGSFWFQHTPSGAAATKPPLQAWASWALADKLNLSWDLAWRLPALVAGVAVMYMLSKCAGKKYGRTGALLAVAAFTLTLLTPRIASLVRTDMMLTATVFAAGLLSYRHIASSTPWSQPSRLALSAIVAISCFLKGPIIFVFVFLPLLVCVVIGRRRKWQALQLAWPGLWPWLLGLAPFLVWVFCGVSNDAFREQVIGREFAGRFATGENAVHGSQPFYFYVVHLLHKLFPWSLILLFSLAYSPVRRKILAEPQLLYLVLWAGTALLAMSLVPSKRVDRIFPIVPVIALLVPAAAEAWFHSARCLTVRRTTILYAVLCVACLTSGGYAIVKPALAVRDGLGGLQSFANTVRNVAHSRLAKIAVVRPKHESLFLYLREATFCADNHALKLWNREQIGVIVINEDRLERIENELGAFTIGAKISSSLGKPRAVTYLMLLKLPVSANADSERRLSPQEFILDGFPVQLVIEAKRGRDVTPVNTPSEG